MVQEGIVLGHKILEKRIEVDMVKIEVIEQLLPPTNVMGIRNFLGHPRLYQRFMIVGWVPIFWEVRGKSIGGELDVDDEGSKQHRFKPVQSLHRGSVGYQPVRTWIGLAKKTMSLQANWEHKQEQERAISNCRWVISSGKLGSYNLNVGETVLDRLI
jgi:hypothetical protein